MNSFVIGILRGLIFCAVLAVVAGLMWLAGYDFDRRGVDVAATAASALVWAVLAASWPLKLGDKP